MRLFMNGERLLNACDDKLVKRDLICLAGFFISLSLSKLMKNKYI